jgi:hypothetical protein
MPDLPAGDVDYQVIGTGYAQVRRPDPRIAALIDAALGDARTVLNVGAGAGSYEPADRHVLALEPAAAMRAQRPRSLAPAIIGRAESLPFDDQSVDASMATITVHQWQGRDAGLRELVRVTRGPIVVMAFDRDRLDRFWLNDYAPDLLAAHRARDPSVHDLGHALAAGGRDVRVLPVPIPHDCTDGFAEAFFARPEKFLDPAVTRAQSGWSFVSPASKEHSLARLADDLRSGAWDAKYAPWRTMPTFDGSLRLIVSTPK